MPYARIRARIAIRNSDPDTPPTEEEVDLEVQRVKGRGETLPISVDDIVKVLDSGEEVSKIIGSCAHSLLSTLSMNRFSGY